MSKKSSEKQPRVDKSNRLFFSKFGFVLCCSSSLFLVKAILNGKLCPILEKPLERFNHKGLLEGVVYISDRKHVTGRQFKMLTGQ